VSDASSDVFNNPADIAQLIATARAWMLDDPDPETAAEIAALVDRAQAVPVEAVHAQAVPVQAAPDESNDPADALDVLRSRFAGRLAFGTAGLRGKIGAGQSLMNSKVVVQTSAGFAQFLMQRAAASASSRTLPEAPSVVVGFDARTKSRQFAFDTAQVLSGAGLSVTLLDGPVPTPVVAFAVRHLNASAGVMITASHNPPQDNGYKVYLGDADAGSQIASPVDAQIAALIDDAACLPLAEIPRDGFVEVDAAATRGVLDGFVAAAVAGVAAASGEISSKSRASQMYTSGALGNALKLKIVYTAMHGVGFELTKRVFAAAGLPELMSVPEQEHPDGTFPTVNYPNPEEPGALDLAIALAEREHADLIIAHDPDADRLAVALPSRSCATNGHQMRDGNGKGFTQLTGNELGLLLGWECAERASNQPVMDGRPAALAATIVSSPALGAVAAAYGLSFVQTLSGFKWVSRVPNLIFGFEEALGYLVNPAVVRDKDGISAAALLTDIAARLQADGKTLWHRLDEASERFGHFASDQITVRLSSSDEAEAMSAGIRSHLPTAFGEVAVERFTDFSNSTHHFGGMPVATNLLRFDLEDGSRVMIRPSGTEPKLKVYLDANCLEGTVSERRANAEARVGALRSATEELIVGLLNQLIPLP
jgi:phosphomannomutase